MASVTTWTRLEPHPRDGTLQRGLQAQVRDPLWFLARQWQVGEFAGDDAGSPVQATMHVTGQPLTGYGPDDSGQAAGPYQSGLPLETHIERMPVTLNVRGAAQLGHRVEAAIRAVSTPAVADDAIAALRTAYPIAATVAPDSAEDTLGRTVRSCLAGRVVDGLALAAAYAVAVAGGTPSPPLPAQAAQPQVAAALADLVAYRASLYSEPSGDVAWRSRRLDYAATVTSTATGEANAFALVAPDFAGGDLDWYSFTLAAPAAADPAPATAFDRTVNFLPNHVTFRGMPAPRWWEFEDGRTDFGALQPDQVDLPTLLVMEFALVFGNDWFVVPVPTPVGTLSRIAALVVTDTFGVRTAINPASATSSSGPETARWSMFALGDSPYLLLPPSCGVVMEGEPVEDVRYLRDDMAAMAWAVEHRIQGPLDAGIDAQQLALDHDAAYPTPSPPPRTPGGPGQTYVLETSVPDNWIPLVPVVAPTGARYFRRGVVVRPARPDTPPAARLLEPGQPLFVADESVPREGAQTTRYFRRTRWSDGSTVTWLAHRTRPGRGEGWSGLAFDRVVPLPPATD
jgi:hypothetical protein